MTALEIDPYLAPYIVEQNPSLYTAMDHASWRFIMRIARSFFATHAHKKYLDGLRETGISVERIPLITEMDEALRKFGWRAVGITGFIPPAVFFEFLSKGILPIACDMRKLENLSYTPAPDIVHEAAGHAPILADPEYAAYVRLYGELSRHAIFSKKDLEVYEAVRKLSDTKEDPSSTPEEIAAAQKFLDETVASVDYDSEATQLTRMGWWTTEYGLVGDPSDPKIYGAGLLSSIGESYHCLSEDVKKVPFSIKVIDQTFDITRPQPQLFIAPDFATLKRGLEELASRMAYKVGGVEGLNKAKRAATVTTIRLQSGVEISGILSDWIADRTHLPAYLKIEGPAQLSFREKELEGQGPKRHTHGFGTPIGMLKGGRSPTDLSDDELTPGHLEFESGVVVEGKYVGAIRREGKTLVVTFKDCTVRLGNEILFKPEWGEFDMACGARVVSVFGGAADRCAYLLATDGIRKERESATSNLTDENRALVPLYAEVREIRESNAADAAARLAKIHDELDKKWPGDWLLRLELLELSHTLQLKAPWESSVRARLAEISRDSRDKAEMISRGLAELK